MLIRLILFLTFVGAAWTVIAVWRRVAHQLRAGYAGLDMAEFEQLHELATDHPRLRHALQLRINIVQVAAETDKRELSTKVDSAIRRLGQQIQIKRRIATTLAEIDRDRLSREVAGAQAQAATADPDAPIKALAQQLEVQLEQVDRLDRRQKALDSAADHIVLLLGNLNLALLESASSEATEDSDRVQSVLADLEEAGETLRRTTEAEEEVARMLKASRTAISAGG